MTAPMTPPGWYPDPASPSHRRYWDGLSWSANAVAAPLRLSSEDRADILNRAILAERARVPTVRVESHSPHQAVLVYGGDTNNVLHAVLTLLTCCLWLIVWLLSMKPTVRRVVTVDPYGQVSWL